MMRVNTHWRAKPRGSRARKKINRPEQIAGASLVKWIDLHRMRDGTRPGQYFAHIPNGGARNPIEAGILKGQGVRAGWPDYILMLPRGRYHALLLELKADDGKKPDEDQLKVLARLEEAGYKTAVAWGWHQAREQILAYLKLPAHVCDAEATA